MSILTTEELDALPAGSVIREVGDNEWRTWCDYRKLDTGQWQVFDWDDELDKPFQLLGNLALQPVSSSDFGEAKILSLEVKTDAQEGVAA